MESINEIYNIIESLETEGLIGICKINHDLLSNMFQLRSDGTIIIVEMFGLELWRSDTDERDYIEETDQTEPLDIHLRRKANELIDLISNIKINELT